MTGPGLDAALHISPSDVKRTACPAIYSGLATGMPVRGCCRDQVTMITWTPTAS
jgi:hypothetical protein